LLAGRTYRLQASDHLHGFYLWLEDVETGTRVGRRFAVLPHTEP